MTTNYDHLRQHGMHADAPSLASALCIAGGIVLLALALAVLMVPL